MAASRGTGTKLKIGSGVTAKAVASLTEIGGLSLSAETIDTTTLDSDGGYREFMGGFKDGGEVSVSGFFDPTEETGHMGIYALFESGDQTDMIIEFPSKIGASWIFKGVVTSFATTTGIDDPVKFESTIKVSGKPTLELTMKTMT